MVKTLDEARAVGLCWTTSVELCFAKTQCDVSHGLVAFSHESADHDPWVHSKNWAH